MARGNIAALVINAPWTRIFCARLVSGLATGLTKLRQCSSLTLSLEVDEKPRITGDLAFNYPFLRPVRLLAIGWFGSRSTMPSPHHGYYTHDFPIPLTLPMAIPGANPSSTD
jgi:hypothetical protein